MLLADKGYDANALRALVGERGAWANIPPKSNVTMRRRPQYGYFGSSDLVSR